MNRALILLSLALTGCNGAVLPIALNSESDAGGPSEGQDASPQDASPQDGGAAPCTSKSTPPSGIHCACDAPPFCSNGEWVCGNAGEQTCPNDAGPADCPPDAGGNSCLCGDLICVGGQWTCGNCAADAGPAPGCSSCLAWQVCVRDQVQGGAVIFPNDAGVCPAGLHMWGDQCINDPTYFCVEKPALCENQPLSCSCAGVLCSSQNSNLYKCVGAAASEVDCEADVP
jgi:hypothetical protein